MGVLQVVCCLDEAHILGGGGGSKVNIFSRWGRRGDSYTAQEDLKSINSYSTGEGRMIGSGFSVPAFQDPPWFYRLFFPSLYF